MVFSVTYYIKKIKCYFEKSATFSYDTTKSCKCNKVFRRNIGKKPNIPLGFIGNHDRKTDISDNPYHAFACNRDSEPAQFDPLFPKVQRRKTQPFRKRDSDKRRVSLHRQTNSVNLQEKILFFRVENLPFPHNSFGTRNEGMKDPFSFRRLHTFV